ncbi:phosphate uptake regulator PhoU [Candidatus Woesearchaeota archaeon]|nr:phosphate uptake regulator PhoU [Candidatus Woesearchaeota archaeon]
MFIRRLVKAGQSSHTIALPKPWLDKHSLKRGDSVYLVESGDEIIMKANPAKQTSSKEISINVDKKPIEAVQREVASAYVNNYSSIILTGESLPQLTRQVRSILHDFMALEITEQTQKRLVAKDLLNTEEVAVDKTLRRMDMIVRSMLSDIRQSLATGQSMEPIMLRDYDVNRLYFVIARMVRKSFASHSGIASLEAFDSWLIASNLEALADDIKEACTLLGSHKEHAALLEAIEQHYLDASKAFFGKDNSLADAVCQKRDAIMQRIDEMKGTDAASIQLSSTLKQMVSTINAFCRAVLDRTS